MGLGGPWGLAGRFNSAVFISRAWGRSRPPPTIGRGKRRGLAAEKIELFSFHQRGPWAGGTICAGRCRRRSARQRAQKAFTGHFRPMWKTAVGERTGGGPARSISLVFVEIFFSLVFGKSPPTTHQPAFWYANQRTNFAVPIGGGPSRTRIWQIWDCRGDKGGGRDAIVEQARGLGGGS